MARLIDGDHDLLGAHADLDFRGRRTTDPPIGVIENQNALVLVEDDKYLGNGLKRGIEDFTGFLALAIEFKIIRNVMNNADETGLLACIIGDSRDA